MGDEEGKKFVTSSQKLKNWIGLLFNACHIFVSWFFSHFHSSDHLHSFSFSLPLSSFHSLTFRHSFFFSKNLHLFIILFAWSVFTSLPHPLQTSFFFLFPPSLLASLICLYNKCVTSPGSKIRNDWLKAWKELRISTKGR